MVNDIINKIENIIKSSESDKYTLVSKIKSIIDDHESENNNPDNSTDFADLFEDHIKRINSPCNQETVIKSGFADMDKLSGGFLPGELVIVGGRPGIGKTQLMLNLAINIAKEMPVLYFSLDLSQQLLTNRIVATLSGIRAGKIFQNELSQDERKQINDLQPEIKKLRLTINDQCSCSISNIIKTCEKQIEEKGIKVIFIDFLQLLYSYKFRQNREAEIGLIVRTLKNFAKTNKVCLVISSQLSRAVETRGGDKRPMLSDLRESGAIEQDSDKVIFIYRPEYYKIDCFPDGRPTSCHTELILEKNRNGNVGSVIITRDEAFTTFKDLEFSNTDFNFSSERFDEIIHAPF